MPAGTLKKNREKKHFSAGGLHLGTWFESYESTDLLFAMFREEVARLPKRKKLRILAQMDSLREDLGEMVKASF